MFDTLMESRRRRERRVVEAIASIAVHAAIVVFAALATMRTVTPVRASPGSERPIWIDATARSGGGGAAASRGSIDPARPTGTPSDFVAEPIAIDLDVGSVRLDGPPIDIDAVLGRIGAPSGGSGGSGGPGASAPGDVLAAGSVERIASLREGSPTPRYPASLRAAGVEGRVRVRLVIDTLGRIEPGSPTVLDSAHPLFTGAVRDVLPRLRFSPATAGGRRVRMWVEMPFEFRMD